MACYASTHTLLRAKTTMNERGFPFRASHSRVPLFQVHLLGLFDRHGFLCACRCCQHSDALAHTGMTSCDAQSDQCRPSIDCRSAARVYSEKKRKEDKVTNLGRAMCCKRLEAGTRLQSLHPVPILTTTVETATCLLVCLPVFCVCCGSDVHACDEHGALLLAWSRVMSLCLSCPCWFLLVILIRHLAHIGCDTLRHPSRHHTRTSIATRSSWQHKQQRA